MRPSLVVGAANLLSSPGRVILALLCNLFTPNTCGVLVTNEALPEPCVARDRCQAGLPEEDITYINYLLMALHHRT
ncbi:hypothetical protein PoB_005764100 [Plakobranchus ocellatus]|uniref:Secreted protein n=1 Tax=Plakobranchus ocellatus TaxID=259542 RepID=A0AAV4C762_9GAST|nr:hypothetical protein PoB_005764100 [Plakobranchus ocellatus]